MKSVTDIKKIIKIIEQHGIFLQQDKTRDNLVSLITGEFLSSSWWNHRDSHTIFRILEELSESPQLTLCKAVSGKVTFIHHRLWTALYTIGICKETWQIKPLKKDEALLFQKIELNKKLENPGKPVKRLEKLLLIHSLQVHSAAGKHITIARSWDDWAVENRVCTIDLAQAKASFCAAVISIGGDEKDLPWH